MITFMDLDDGELIKIKTEIEDILKEREDDNL